MDLSTYLEEVFACQCREDLDEVLISAFEGLGAVALSGYAFPSSRPASTAHKPILSTWPEEVKTAYRSLMAGDDPIMYAAMSLGMPVHFLKLEKSLSFSPDGQRVLEAMRTAGIHDGVTTPVYSRPGAFAYFVAAFREERPDLTIADLRRIKFLFSEYYYRFREISRVHGDELSKREREVLIAIANDKSNAEIARMLGVSEHTVGTYVRRCFEKLDVKSRTQAVVRYLGGGLVD